MVDTDASEEQIWEALEFSSAAEFVKKLPQGLDTVIGDRGIRLSGGERQTACACTCYFTKTIHSCFR